MEHSLILSLNFQFEADNLAPERYEANPELIWWNSTNRHDVIYTPIKFLNEHKLTSVKTQLDIPISNPGELHVDDYLGVECLVESINDEGIRAKSKAGSALILLSKLLKMTTRETINVDLRMNTMFDGNRRKAFKKGAVKIEIREHPGKDSWRFVPYLEKNVPFLDENIPLYDEVLTRMCNRAIIPFVEEIREFDPTEEVLRRYQLPCYNNEVFPLPGVFFWVDYTKHPADEHFLYNLAKIALDRYQVSKKDFIRSVDNQFDAKSSRLNDDFRQCVIIVSDMICTPSISLEYIGDFTYVSKRGSRNVEDYISTGDEEEEEEEENLSEYDKIGRKKDIESFHDALRMKAGDCEDLAGLNHRVATLLLIGRPEYKNGYDRHRKYGGWKSKLLDRMQKIAHLYVGFGSLGSVTARYLGEDKSESTLVKQPPIEGSVQDRRADIGAHMWWEWIPLCVVEKFINNGIKDQKNHIILFPDDPHSEWEYDLPHIVGEGTGYLHPLLKPPKEYYHESGERKEVEKMNEEKLCVLKDVLSDCPMFKKFQFQKLQTMKSIVPGSRLSCFYRDSIHLYTDRFLLEGIPVGEFTWVKSTDKHKKWQWAASMYTKLYERQENIILMPSTYYIEEEIPFIHSITRLLPPLKEFSLSRTFEFNENLLKRVDALKSKLEYELSGRDEPEKYTFFNVIIRSTRFHKKTEREEKEQDRKLVEQIVKCELIYKVDVSLEVITDDIHNVRLQIFCAIEE